MGRSLFSFKMQTKITNKVKKYLLSLVVFISGFSVMSIEITGSRILAPSIGTSIIAWTSLIGIVLACLSLGYYLGGEVADKYPKTEVLGLIIGTASVYLFAIGLLNIPILTFLRERISDLLKLSVISSLVLFGLPSVLLGMVAPFAMKLSIKNINKAGRVSGNLYAISTMGSILGTFLTGLYLIPVMGSSNLLLLSALMLLMSAFLMFLTTKITLKKSLFFLFFSVFAGLSMINYDPPSIGFYDKDSKYNRIILDIITRSSSKRPVLALISGRYLDQFQSGMYLDNESELVAGYTKYYRLVNHFLKDPKEVLMIGGGGYSYPKDFLNTNPKAKIDVIEIDEEITVMARKYFNLPDNPQLTIYHEDGRLFLNNNKKQYDAIFLDVYSGDSSMPFYLTTEEALLEMKTALKDDGVIIMNVVSAVKGEKGKFFQAEYNTYKKVFPQVYFFPFKEDMFIPQNIILVASKNHETLSFESANREYAGYLSNVYRGEILSDMPVLTDDYAPVEYYLYERLK